MLNIFSRSGQISGKRSKVISSGQSLFILSLLLVFASAKIYSRCELARTLKQFGLDGYYNYSLANWVCMAYYESRYNTAAINHNKKHGKIWSTDYGIFQINSQWWCKDQQTKGGKNICKVQCADLLNDYLGDDCRCAKIIVQASKGMKAWVGWKNHCKGRDVSYFVRGCRL
ncbi:lysozyme C-1-like [Pristis pectinata]|uniref:lysozyme C-1-like n=1 Tax=Pristis pectinata TaxID=685728 RepID=UPI00223DD1C5|nr:lysozyme C-1-like [Pristis pectinata]